jgi:hypothetical protein
MLTPIGARLIVLVAAMMLISGLDQIASVGDARLPSGIKIVCVNMACPQTASILYMNKHKEAVKYAGPMLDPASTLIMTTRQVWCEVYCALSAI